MTSNAYVGQGVCGNAHVMKVGKSNNVTRRERELGITIEHIAQCISETTALELENHLREFVIQEGGVRYKRTLDWFEFDKRIYNILVIFFNQEYIRQSPELNEEDEILLFQEKYYDLLQTSLEDAEEQIEILQEEVERLRDQLQRRVDTVRDQERQKASEREQQLLDEIIKLNCQMARLEVRMQMLQEHEDDENE